MFTCIFCWKICSVCLWQLQLLCMMVMKLLLYYFYLRVVGKICKSNGLKIRERGLERVAKRFRSKIITIKISVNLTSLFMSCIQNCCCNSSHRYENYVTAISILLLNTFIRLKFLLPCMSRTNIYSVL